MTGDDSALLLRQFTRAAESGDGGIAMVQPGSNRTARPRCFQRWARWLKQRRRRLSIWAGKAIAGEI